MFRRCLGDATGEFDLTVLGNLARIEASSEEIELNVGDPTATFDVIGYDGTGYSAPIESADVELAYDESAMDIDVNKAGELSVTSDGYVGSGGQLDYDFT